MLAVAQGGVEDDQLVAHGESPQSANGLSATVDLQRLRTRHAGQQRLERCGHDVGIDAHAVQPALADAHLDVGRRARLGAGADGMLVVVQHLQLRIEGALQRGDEGVDRAAALPVQIDDAGVDSAAHALRRTRPAPSSSRR